MRTIEPNEADMDAVNIKCECGNSFDMPRDALFALSDIYCGQCGGEGAMKITADNDAEMEFTQIYAAASDLAYMRIVKDALHRMSVGDMETAPPEILQMYKRCCRDAGALRAYFEGCVEGHENKTEATPK